MFKGFYNLTSGMLSQTRRLDVVANNMTNTGTIGFKADIYTDSTFQEYLISRVGNQDKRSVAEVGEASFILAPSRVYTDYTQGAPQETGLPLDFAIEGEGFFAIQRDDGIAYTRAGNFCLDNEGYLWLADQGQVLDSNEQPILLITDKITADKDGNLYDDNGGYLGQLGVYTFDDNDQLVRTADGMYQAGGQQAASVTMPIHQKMLERSNVELIQQMVSMMSTQRALQSAAQMSKMYDQVMTKATTDLGRM